MIFRKFFRINHTQKNAMMFSFVEHKLNRDILNKKKLLYRRIYSSAKQNLQKMSNNTFNVMGITGFKQQVMQCCSQTITKQFYTNAIDVLMCHSN